MKTPDNTTIGFIGTGVMGKSMAGHLLDAGYALNVYNRTKERANMLRVDFGDRVRVGVLKVDKTRNEIELFLVDSPESKTKPPGRRALREAGKGSKRSAARTTKKARRKKKA